MFSHGVGLVWEVLKKGLGASLIHVVQPYPRCSEHSRVLCIAFSILGM